MDIRTLLASPPQLLATRIWLRFFGSLRLKEQYDVLPRSNHAYAMTRAASLARYFGYKKVTICEFGVASGHGLMNMIELAAKLTRVNGIEYRIVGFDTGEGLPEVSGHKDHPEIWSAGDFTGPDKEELEKQVAGRAELIFGDIKDTVGPFMDTLTPECPLAFISVDVDIYSASKSALNCLTGPTEKYFPAVGIYFDDTEFYFANKWGGELAAIEEFNEEQENRKIDQDRSLPGRRPVRDANWHRQMFVCHILDHELRNRPRDRNSLDIGEHNKFMKESSVL
jgi:hypothetical protein